jgi:hypothetical protein
MKAIRVHEFGGPEVLRIEEVPTPQPGPVKYWFECARSALTRSRLTFARELAGKRWESRLTNCLPIVPWVRAYIQPGLRPARSCICPFSSCRKNASLPCGKHLSRC